ncbi:hypothetical protein BY996DRAFT_6557732 [Phakopsora pachyrhizi]|nr:hypothetical protein BY996DRAFT_6557732 [Phakopsora pachyrhizi]
MWMDWQLRIEEGIGYLLSSSIFEDIGAKNILREEKKWCKAGEQDCANTYGNLALVQAWEFRIWMETDNEDSNSVSREKLENNMKDQASAQWNVLVNRSVVKDSLNKIEIRFYQQTRQEKETHRWTMDTIKRNEILGIGQGTGVDSCVKLSSKICWLSQAINSPGKDLGLPIRGMYMEITRVDKSEDWSATVNAHRVKFLLGLLEDEYEGGGTEAAVQKHETDQCSGSWLTGSGACGTRIKPSMGQVKI